MRLLFLSLAALIIAVMVALLAMEDPGYVLIAVGQWTVETTLVLTVVVVLMAFGLGYFLILGGRKILAVPREMRQWQQQRHEQKALQALTQGLIDLAEGRWQSAEKKLLKYVDESEASLLNYLAAARAAQAQGAYQRRDHYLKLAHESNPSADIAVGLTQAELQLQQQQLEQALATLRHLQQLAPKHVQVLKALANVYQRLGDWEHLLEVMPHLRKRKVLAPQSLDKLSRQAYLALLQGARDKTEVARAWSRIPGKLQDEEALLQRYVQRLIDLGESDLAEPLLRHALRRHYSKTLILLYGRIDSAEPARQLAMVEALLEEYPNDAAILLTAGRLCLRNKLWGKARRYLEASLNVEPTPEAYNELGNLLERMNETDAAAECFREGLRLAPGCEQTTPISMEPASSPALALMEQNQQEAETQLRDVVALVAAGKTEVVEDGK